MDILANNIANIATPGFKAIKAVISISNKAATGDGGEVVSAPYINIGEVYRDFSEGDMKETKAPLDLAIQGDGFFVATTPKGTMYTRNGRFSMDGQKKLVTADGARVMGNNGEITLEGGKEIRIEEDGSVYMDKNLVGKIRVVTFAKKENLQNEGNSYFSTPDAPADATGKYTVRQGFLEQSNVSAMTELIDLITVMRAYEACTKIDQQIADLASKMINMGRM